MSVAEQFAGLEMDKLIGAPLSAAADASIQLANSTADFISTVGFDDSGKARTAAFVYQRRRMNEDGTSNLDEMKVDVPMLSIVPIPNLQIDEVNLLFDMEVKQSEKRDAEMELGAAGTGAAGFGPAKVSISGNVSTHSSNIRTTDNSAKYHVDIKAVNHGVPEGLARVMDMMSASLSPVIVHSSLKDGNGQNLPEDELDQVQRRQALRKSMVTIDLQMQEVQKCLNSHIQQMRNTAEAQLRLYKKSMTEFVNTPGNGEDEKRERSSRAMAEVRRDWNAFLEQIEEKIKMMADSGEADSKKISELFGLRTWKAGKVEDYTPLERYYNDLLFLQNQTVKMQIELDYLTKMLLERKAEYSAVERGRLMEQKEDGVTMISEEVVKKPQSKSNGLK